MEDHEGKGGSYIRQRDGTLKLVERTEHPDTVYAVEEPVGEQREPAEPALADPIKKGGK